MSRPTYLIRRHWRPLAVGLVLAGLALNVWIQDGTVAFLAVLLAIVGAGMVLGSVGWLTGTLAIRHARREARAIRSGNHPMREVTK
jgi:uncharacterized membrane protein